MDNDAKADVNEDPVREEETTSIGSDDSDPTEQDLPTSPDDGARLEDVDVAALLAERDSFRDIAQRLQADFENYRKRVAAQTSDDIDRATGRIAESLLPVLDACEAAFVAHPQQVEPLFNLLLGELKKQGLEVMDLSGKPFDPELAEAVMHEPGDSDGGTVVVDVLRTGYLWKGRVLRAAMVKVRG
ncbi:MAG: nucleotide exchange factor GrpE [Actinomycetota bacterium]